MNQPETNPAVAPPLSAITNPAIPGPTMPASSKSELFQVAALAHSPRGITEGSSEPSAGTVKARATATKKSSA